jgi:hypothetical protein
MLQIFFVYFFPKMNLIFDITMEGELIYYLKSKKIVDLKFAGSKGVKKAVVKVNDEIHIYYIKSIICNIEIGDKIHMIKRGGLYYCMKVNKDSPTDSLLLLMSLVIKNIDEDQVICDKELSALEANHNRKLEFLSDQLDHLENKLAIVCLFMSVSIFLLYGFVTSIIWFRVIYLFSTILCIPII